MSVHQHKDGRWYCKWREPGGKQLKRYFGRGNLARALAERLDEKIREERGRIKLNSNITVAELCQQYHLKHPVEQSTLKSDFYQLDRVVLPLLGSTPADDGLSSKEIAEYVKKRVSNNVRIRTVDRELDLLRAAYSWGHRQDPPLVVRDPFKSFRLQAVKDSFPPAPPRMEEVRAILTHAPNHLRRALLLEWYCGVRPGGEVSRILWQDVDLDGNELRLESARKGGPVIRDVPTCAPLKEHMLCWMTEDQESLRPGAALARIPLVHYQFKSCRSLKRSWKTAKTKAGITRRIRLCDLRHARASLALKGGADLKATSEILGHSRPDTTIMVYQHVTRDQHREVVGKIPILHWGPLQGTSPKRLNDNIELNCHLSVRDAEVAGSDPVVTTKKLTNSNLYNMEAFFLACSACVAPRVPPPGWSIHGAVRSG